MRRSRTNKLWALQGGFAPLTRHQGQPPPDPCYRLALCARHGSPNLQTLPTPLVPGSESSWNFRSREWKFHTIVILLPGVKVLRSESSCYPVKHSLSGAKVLRNIRSRDPGVIPSSCRSHWSFQNVSGIIGHGHQCIFRAWQYWSYTGSSFEVKGRVSTDLRHFFSERIINSAKELTFGIG